MSDPILEGVVQDIEDTNELITRAETLISVMKEAGEDVSKQESELRAAKMRRDKWKKVLLGRGYSFDSSKR